MTANCFGFLVSRAYAGITFGVGVAGRNGPAGMGAEDCVQLGGIGETASSSRSQCWLGLMGTAGSVLRNVSRTIRRFTPSFPRNTCYRSNAERLIPEYLFESFTFPSWSASNTSLAPSTTRSQHPSKYANS